MSIVKVPAVIAALLFLSSASAQAMEFADRPGLAPKIINSLSAIPGTQTDDYSRRQINNHNVLLADTAPLAKLADRPGPVSNLIRTNLSQSEDRPGRLSAEFSGVSVGSGIKFEHRPWMVSSRSKAITTRAAMRFEDRPGPMSNRFTADHRGFTSSLAKTKTPFGLHVRPGAVEFCVGRIVPCGPLSLLSVLTNTTNESNRRPIHIWLSD
jgi:hypothetical protein